MPKTIAKRPSEPQKLLLVEFLEQHVNLANDKLFTVDHASIEDQLWDQITQELNSLGGAYKDVLHWKRFWIDFRNYITNKYTGMENGRRKYGAVNKRKLKPLTEVEKKVLGMINLRRLVGGRHSRDLRKDDFSEEQEGSVINKRRISKTKQEFKQEVDQHMAQQTNRKLNTDNERLNRRRQQQFDHYNEHHQQPRNLEKNGQFKRHRKWQKYYIMQIIKLKKQKLEETKKQTKLRKQFLKEEKKTNSLLRELINKLSQ